jgi:predicted MPP superfamily phosphohydrolase
MPAPPAGHVVSTLLHLSDPHFGTERAPVLAALRRFVQEAAPGLVVLSGDLNQRAQDTIRRGARVRRAPRCRAACAATLPIR